MSNIPTLAGATTPGGPLPEPEPAQPLKAEKMAFGRWFKLVGWRHAVALVFVLWALIPAFYIISLAFSGGNSLTAACPASRSGLSTVLCVIPTKFSLSNFTDLFGNDQYPYVTWLRNTLIIATANAAGALIMGAMAAYAFSRMRFRGRRGGLLLLMLIQMFPQVLGLIAIYALLNRVLDVAPALGLGHIWGLTLVYLGGALGVNTFLLKGYFDTVPVDIDESARIDGAGHFRIFLLIARLSTPIMVVVFFVSFNATFNELPVALVVLPDANNTTMAVGLYGFVSNPQIQQWGLLAAGGLIAAIPLFALFLFTQKSLVTGLTAGAVKG